MTNTIIGGVVLLSLTAIIVVAGQRYHDRHPPPRPQAECIAIGNALLLGCRPAMYTSARRNRD